MTARMVRGWVRVGVVAGLVACVSYPLLVFVRMPPFLGTIVALSFGPALGFASVGLYQFLKLHRDGIAAQAAAVSNLLAGALVTAMLAVQLAVATERQAYFAAPDADEGVRTIIHWVWDVILGLDVAFDVYIGLGTLLFGVAMLDHPRLGRVIGWAGILIAVVGTLGFNLYTQPTPPADAGLLDTGPLSGLWYLAVVVLIWRSRRWVDERLGAESPGDGQPG